MLTRRHIFRLPAIAALASPAAAFAGQAPDHTPILTTARLALQRHREHVTQTDRIGVADFSQPSSRRRFHILDVNSGRLHSVLVAHGKGSDPAHTGWLKSFSNTPGSEATSKGAFLTADAYTGKHGWSRRLVGLDPDNSNAFSRAIVIHSAWYVNEDMARAGKLGRSQGCFAFSKKDLANIMELLPPGSLIISANS